MRRKTRFSSLGTLWPAYLLLLVTSCSSPDTAPDDPTQGGAAGRSAGSSGAGATPPVAGSTSGGAGAGSGGAAGSAVGGAGGAVANAGGGNSGLAGDAGGAAFGGTGGGTGAGGAAGGADGAGGSGASGASAGGASGAGAGGGGAAPGGGCDAVSTVAGMKLGWNLGNSLDAFDANMPDTTVETAWGNPLIRRELLAAVAGAGFGAIRIPVTWIGRFGPAPDHTISPTFLNRVEEVVNLALDTGVYVIINVHHDGAEGVDGEWLSLVDESGQVSSTHTAQVLAQFRTIWTQIAARFQDYGERLLFESMNELKVGYDTPLPAYLEQVNGLNQAFVDTVRASGGYNPERCLVVPGYNTNIDHTVAGFVKPNDASPGKLILSDHYYDPWSFAGEASTPVWGAGYPETDDWGQEDWVRGQVAKLTTTFVDQGLPVILGEYGAVQQDGSEDYRRYYVEYVTKAFHDAGIVPFAWDNGALASGAEGFGLFDRSTDSVRYPVIVEAMVRAVTSSYALADVVKP